MNVYTLLRSSHESTCVYHSPFLVNFETLNFIFNNVCFRLINLYQIARFQDLQTGFERVQNPKHHTVSCDQSRRVSRL